MTLPSTIGQAIAVGTGEQSRIGDAIASALDWWVAAGVDTAIAETPRDWLAPPAPRPAASALPIAAPIAPALPGDLAAFQAMLATEDYGPGAPPPRRRVPPAGDPGAGLMIVTDMPDPGDHEAGRLFAGESAALFEAMIAAVGWARDTIYLAPLSPARITGGRLDPAIAAPLVRLMARHIALVKPRLVWVMGEETRKALGLGLAEPGGGLRVLNHDDGIVPVMVTPHPRSLRQHPAGKAEAWLAMRALIGVFAQ